MTWVDGTRSVDATIAVYLDGYSCNELYLAEKIAKRLPSRTQYAHFLRWLVSRLHMEETYTRSPSIIEMRERQRSQRSQRQVNVILVPCEGTIAALSFAFCFFLASHEGCNGCSNASRCLSLRAARPFCICGSAVLLPPTP